MCQALGQRSFRAIIKLNQLTMVQILFFCEICTITNIHLCFIKKYKIFYIYIFLLYTFIIFLGTFKPGPVLVISL